MKKILLFLCCCGLFHFAKSQDKDLQVIASAGNTLDAGNIFLDWTLGELVVDFFDHASAGLSQGFHQPRYQLVSVKSIPEDMGSIVVFPSPLSDELSVKMTFTHQESGHIELLDLDGTLIWSRPFKGNVIAEQYSAVNLPSGAYVLMVSVSGASYISTYQLVKIQ